MFLYSFIIPYLYCCCMISIKGGNTKADENRLELLNKLIFIKYFYECKHNKKIHLFVKYI